MTILELPHANEVKGPDWTEAIIVSNDIRNERNINIAADTLFI